MAFNEESSRVRYPARSSKIRTVRKYCLRKPVDGQITQQEIDSFLNILYLELQLHEGRKCGHYIATDTYIEVIFNELIGNGYLDIFEVFSDITKLLLITTESNKSTKSDRSDRSVGYCGS